MQIYKRWIQSGYLSFTIPLNNRKRFYVALWSEALWTVSILKTNEPCGIFHKGNSITFLSVPNKDKRKKRGISTP